MMLLESLMKSRNALDSIISVLNNYRKDSDFDNRLNDWMEKNAWVCEEIIDPVLKKTMKMRNENGVLLGI